MGYQREEIVILKIEECIEGVQQKQIHIITKAVQNYYLHSLRQLLGKTFAFSSIRKLRKFFLCN